MYLARHCTRDPTAGGWGPRRKHQPSFSTKRRCSTTATPAPTVTPTPAATPTPTSRLVLKRELDYRYTIEVPDGWNQESEGVYTRTSPWARLTVTSQVLPSGYTIDRFTQLVQDDLRRDWWLAASLFEITSVEESKIAGQPGRLIRYRVQESPQYCPLKVEEALVMSQILQGNPHGFRIRTWMCEQDANDDPQRSESLRERLKITTSPAEYYKQFVNVKGVTVKAAESVDPAALEAGADIVARMLSGRQDVARCMLRSRAELAIVPRDQTLTSLPEYQFLKGTRDFTGRSRDSFDIRGVGGVRGRPVSSTGEEQLLGNLGPQRPYHLNRGLVAVHEFAHGIQNLCFTPEDYEMWNGFYLDAVEADLYPGTHMMVNVDEFFAVFTTGYFEVTDELGPVITREDLEHRFQAKLIVDSSSGIAALCAQTGILDLIADHFEICPH